MQVLLIEDDEQLVQIYSTILDSFGARFDVARDGQEALDLLGRNRYKLILLDLMLPKMTGEEFIGRFQTLEIDEKPNIVVLTNMGSGYDRKLLLDSGVNEILLKLDTGPDEIKELLKKYTSS